MSHEFSNPETDNMFQHIKETKPHQLISDAQQALTGYIGLAGIAAEIKSEYSHEFAEHFNEQQLAKVDWQQIVKALASLSQ